MQIFSAEPTIFSKKKNWNYFFTHEHLKKLASKVVHNWAKPLFSQSSPAPSPKLIFYIINMSHDASVSLSVSAILTQRILYLPCKQVIPLLAVSIWGLCNNHRDWHLFFHYQFWFMFEVLKIQENLFKSIFIHLIQTYFYIFQFHHNYLLRFTSKKFYISTKNVYWRSK